MTAEQRMMVKIAIDKAKRAEIQERKTSNAEFALLREAHQERVRRHADRKGQSDTPPRHGAVLDDLPSRGTITVEDG